MNARYVTGALFLACCACGDLDPPPRPQPDGDPEAGARVIARIECGVCHVIPGIRGAHGLVGPPLTDFGRRSYIAGLVPNRPEVLVRWLRDAPSIAPETLMPALPLDEREARDAAAYLYTLR